MSGFARWVPAAWRQRSLQRNVVLNWTATFAAAAISLGLTPVLIGSLETELYGIWTFLNALALYSNLLYLGLGSAFTKRLSEAVGVEDHQAQARLLGIAITLYLVLGSICVVIAAVLSPFSPDLLATPVSADTARAMTESLMLLGVRVLLLFVSSAFGALLASHGRQDLVMGVALVSILVRLAGSLWAVSQPDAMTSLARITALEAILQLPALIWLCRLVAPQVRIRLVVPTRHELRGLYSFSVQAFAVQIGLFAIGYMDTAIIGMILGAAAVTIYALPLQLVEHSRVLVGGITGNLLPELAAAQARGDHHRMRTLFMTSSRGAATLSVFLNVHMILLGPAFLALWVGADLAVESRTILICLSVAATAAAISTQVLAPFYQALDVVRRLALIILVEAIANFTLSVWFASVLGVWGVALATMVPALGVTLLLAPRAILPKVGVTLGELCRALVPAAVLGVALVLTQATLWVWIGDDAYSLLVLRVMCSTAVAVPVLLATFPRDEWWPIVTHIAPTLARRLPR